MNALPPLVIDIKTEIDEDSWRLMADNPLTPRFAEFGKIAPVATSIENVWDPKLNLTPTVILTKIKIEDYKNVEVLGKKREIKKKMSETSEGFSLQQQEFEKAWNESTSALQNSNVTFSTPVRVDENVKKFTLDDHRKTKQNDEKITGINFDLNSLKNIVMQVSHDKRTVFYQKPDNSPKKPAKRPRLPVPKGRRLSSKTSKRKFPKTKKEKVTNQFTDVFNKITQLESVRCEEENKELSETIPNEDLQNIISEEAVPIIEEIITTSEDLIQINSSPEIDKEVKKKPVKQPTRRKRPPRLNLPKKRRRPTMKENEFLTVFNLKKNPIPEETLTLPATPPTQREENLQLNENTFFETSMPLLTPNSSRQSQIELNYLLEESLGNLNLKTPETSPKKIPELPKETDDFPVIPTDSPPRKKPKKPRSTPTERKFPQPENFKAPNNLICKNLVVQLKPIMPNKYLNPSPTTKRPVARKKTAKKPPETSLPQVQIESAFTIISPDSPLLNSDLDSKNVALNKQKLAKKSETLIDCQSENSSGVNSTAETKKRKYFPPKAETAECTENKPKSRKIVLKKPVQIENSEVLTKSTAGNESQVKIEPLKQRRSRRAPKNPVNTSVNVLNSTVKEEKTAETQSESSQCDENLNQDMSSRFSILEAVLRKSVEMQSIEPSRTQEEKNNSTKWKEEVTCESVKQVNNRKSVEAEPSELPTMYEESAKHEEFIVEGAVSLSAEQEKLKHQKTVVKSIELSRTTHEESLKPDESVDEKLLPQNAPPEKSRHRKTVGKKSVETELNKLSETTHEESAAQEVFSQDAQVEKSNHRKKVAKKSVEMQSFEASHKEKISSPKTNQESVASSLDNAKPVKNRKPVLSKSVEMQSVESSHTHEETATSNILWENVKTYVPKNRKSNLRKSVEMQPLEASNEKNNSLEVKESVTSLTSIKQVKNRKPALRKSIETQPSETVANAFSSQSSKPKQRKSIETKKSFEVQLSDADKSHQKPRNNNKKIAKVVKKSVEKSAIEVGSEKHVETAVKLSASLDDRFDQLLKDSSEDNRKRKSKKIFESDSEPVESGPDPKKQKRSREPKPENSFVNEKPKTPQSPVPIEALNQSSPIPNEPQNSIKSNSPKVSQIPSSPQKIKPEDSNVSFPVPKIRLLRRSFGQRSRKREHAKTDILSKHYRKISSDYQLFHDRALFSNGEVALLTTPSPVQIESSKVVSDIRQSEQSEQVEELANVEHSLDGYGSDKEVGDRGKPCFDDDGFAKPVTPMRDLRQVIGPRQCEVNNYVKTPNRLTPERKYSTPRYDIIVSKSHNEPAKDDDVLSIYADSEYL